MVTRWFLIGLAGVVGVALLWLVAVAEMALSSTTTARAAMLAEEGQRGAELLRAQLGQRESMLQTVLLARLTIEFALASLLGTTLRGLGGWSLLPLFVIGVPVIHLVGVVLARAWSLQASLPATAVAPYVVAAARRVVPLRFVASLSRRLVERLFPYHDDRRGEVVDLALIDEAFTGAATSEHAAAGDGRELVHSVAEFGQTVVRQIMVPRTDMATLEAGLSVDEAFRVQADQGWSRYPVEGPDGIDDIIGVAHARDLMEAALGGRADEPMTSVLRAVRFVPESKRAAALLREMQRDQFHLAVVVDEYGGTAGLVTLEDILEELVGEIADEYDEEPPTLQRLADGRVRLAGALLVEEANDELGVALPEGDWDTVGGLVTHHFGRVPRPGELAELEACTIEVERVTGRRVASVVVTLKAPSAGERRADTVSP